MDLRNRRVLVIGGIVFGIIIVAMLVVYFFLPKLPSTQYADKTVIIDNYKEYTEHISPDSFGYLGNYLYDFIKEPSESVYHATIVDDSYSYASDSWFSKFTVKVEDSDITWKISMQTLKDGEINGDIGVTCEGGSTCISFSERLPEATLQSYLPITTSEYIIAYQQGKESISVVYYDRDGVGQAKAQEKIKSLGFNPEDYTIQYFYGGR